MSKLSGVVQRLFEHQLLLKLFHFQTKYYAAHIASDNYLQQYALDLDKLLEVGQGIYGKVPLKKLEIQADALTDETVGDYLVQFHSYLLKLPFTKNQELVNIQDEMLANLSKLLYLLEFQ